VFPALALAFGPFSDFFKTWGSLEGAFSGLLFNILNIEHIAASYTSYKNLPVGSAISLFYLYPIFNVIAGALLFGETLSVFSIIVIAIAFLGMYLITTSKNTEKRSIFEEQYRKKHNYGVIMGIIAAITETLIFVFIRSNKDAQVSPYYTVNHLYPAGLVILLIFGFFNKNMVDTKEINWMKLIGFNALLGFTGYLSRFYAIPKISTLVFSLLSFFGVAFGYTWGILFIGDKPTLKAILGGVLIVGSAGLLRYFS
jgi:drug/metabolite transporter (DMT)-like permease